jgi:hypothetical protein
MNRFNKKIKQLDMRNKNKKIFKLHNTFSDVKYSDVVELYNEDDVLQVLTILNECGAKQHETETTNSMKIPLKLRKKYGY